MRLYAGDSITIRIPEGLRGTPFLTFDTGGDLLQGCKIEEGKRIKIY